MGVGTVAGAGTLSTIADIGGLVLSAIGMSKQEEADEEARREAMMINARDFSLKKRSLASSIAAQRSQLAFQRQQSAREWKWREEEGDYQKAQAFQQNFNGVLNKSPGLRNNLMQVWKTGR